MAKTYYMHTLNGKPATFDGDQICYAVFYGKPNSLASSLRQIRREQQASIRFRRHNCFDGRIEMRYDHLRFAVLDAEESSDGT